MTNADRILTLLVLSPGLDDDEISRRTGVRPRQQVNMICRRLADQGILARRVSCSGKIGNFPLTGVRDQENVAPLVSAGATSARLARTGTLGQPRIALGQTELHNTLILMPCSGRKNHGGTSTATDSQLDVDLPPSLAQRLHDARRAVLATANFDDSLRMPAWQRYSGTLYSELRDALPRAVSAGFHALIISGGYGLIKAGEPIGIYSTRLKLAAWPRGLLEEVLLAYAKCHGVKSVRAFVSRSTDYYRLVARTRWADASIGDVIIATPEATRAALVKTPRAQGQAIAAFLAGELNDDWQSSDGLRLDLNSASR